MEKDSEIRIYKTKDGLTKINVTFEENSVWLSKNQMEELFQRDRSVISKHISNVFCINKLSTKGNVQNLHVTYSDQLVESIVSM